MSCRTGSSDEFQLGAFGGQPSRSFEEANLFLEQGKHRMHTPHRVLLYNSDFMVMIGHLRVGV
jgi:hypothetical protein